MSPQGKGPGEPRTDVLLLLWPPIPKGRASPFSYHLELRGLVSFGPVLGVAFCCPSSARRICLQRAVTRPHGGGVSVETSPGDCVLQLQRPVELQDQALARSARPPGTPTPNAGARVRCCEGGGLFGVGQWQRGASAWEPCPWAALPCPVPRRESLGGSSLRAAPSTPQWPHDLEGWRELAAPPATSTHLRALGGEDRPRSTRAHASLPGP